MAQYYYNGAVWIPYGPMFPFETPNNGDFAWINQGGASVDTAYGGIQLSAPAGAGRNWRIRKKAAPATPYTITAKFAVLGKDAVDASAGLLFRQSSDGKLAIFSYETEYQCPFSWKWTDPSTFSAFYGSTDWRFSSQPTVWIFRIADDGANRICSFSPDGQHWITFHSVGRADFLTADEIGFGIDANDVTYRTDMILFSWEES